MYFDNKEPCTNIDRHCHNSVKKKVKISEKQKKDAEADFHFRWDLSVCLPGTDTDIEKTKSTINAKILKNILCYKITQIFII